jgi:hypothetical protein
VTPEAAAALTAALAGIERQAAATVAGELEQAGTVTVSKARKIELGRIVSPGAGPDAAGLYPGELAFYDPVTGLFTDRNPVQLRLMPLSLNPARYVGVDAAGLPIYAVGDRSYVHEPSEITLGPDGSLSVVGPDGTTSLATFGPGNSLSTGVPITGNVLSAVQYHNCDDIGGPQTDDLIVQTDDVGIIYLYATAAHAITGLTGGKLGRNLRLVNIGPASITLTHDDAASDPENRLRLPASASMILGLNCGVYITWEDESSSEFGTTDHRWRPVGTAGVGGAGGGPGTGTQYRVPYWLNTTTLADSGITYFDGADKYVNLGSRLTLAYKEVDFTALAGTVDLTLSGDANQAELILIRNVAANVAIRTLLPAINGQQLTLYLDADNGFAVSLVNETPSIFLSGKFHLPGGVDLLLASGKAVTLRYDGFISRWILVGTNSLGGGGGVTDGDKGDITVSAGGATWTIDAAAVTFAKMQNVNNFILLGRGSAGGPGDVQSITLDTSLTLTGTVLGVTGASNAVACSVLGRAANSAGVRDDITLTDGQWLGRQASVVDGYFLKGEIVASSFVATDQSTTSSTATDLATPQHFTFTPESTQDYMVTATAVAYTTGAAGVVSLQVDVDGVDTVVAQFSLAGVGLVCSLAGTLKVSLTAATHTIKLQFSTSAGTGHFLSRGISIQRA